ncbi:maleylpyruvate isomerase family mycothiol-dependent enzyme [Nocardioides ginsengisoli]|uniref:Maleylpyruvate isomerase family mycothiol-dependent enzyme n=1 Tax=Nocardioides ginsengisoli TaxID=363868 RepID=A0ABW3VXW9_9ACTN
MDDLWGTIAQERGALAADLAGLDDAQWTTPSLCAGWSVRDVLAHMTNTARTGPMGFLGGMAKAGFKFDKFAEAGIARQSGTSPADTLSRFESVRTSTTAPPGPKTTWLGEAIVHAEDIRRPLGIAHDYPTDAVVEVMDFYKGSNVLIGGKNRVDGLTLRATDTDWSHGSGPAVEGRAIDLLVAMTGRATACDRLSGDGVETLRSRGTA